MRKQKSSAARFRQIVEAHVAKAGDDEVRARLAEASHGEYGAQPRAKAGRVRRAIGRVALAIANRLS